MADVMVRYERDGDIAVITLDRQPVNAYDGAFHAEFQGAWLRAKDDDSRVVVMCAKGKHFCVGANLRDPQPAPPGAVVLSQDHRRKVLSAAEGQVPHGDPAVRLGEAHLGVIQQNGK